MLMPRNELIDSHAVILYRVVKSCLIKRHYELWNDSFERRHRSRPNTGAAWQGFPHIYFPTSMLLHVGFHLQPVIAQTRGAGRVSTWGQLESEDRDMIIAAVSD